MYIQANKGTAIQSPYGSVVMFIVHKYVCLLRD